MNRKPLTLSRVYLAALRKRLKQGADVSPEMAQAMGQTAMALSLDMCHIAEIHQAALLSLLASQKQALPDDTLIRRCGDFFIEAISPIEQAHLRDREANILLTQRTNELAVSNEELKGEIRRRRAVEESLKTSEKTTSQLLAESLRLQKELRGLSRQLLNAQEEERKRISRDLHDVIAQTLAGINLRLAALRSRNTINAEDLNREIARTQRLVEQSVDLVHSFARDLRPTVLDDLGLIPALQSYLEGFMERTGVRVNFAASGSAVESLSSDQRIVLYRVAQESLTNVARHAKASMVDMNILQLDGMITMEIHDNGIGFLMDKLMPSSRRNGRLGMLGMRERVEMAGGTFSVISAPGQQTTVRVTLPLNGCKPKPKRKRAIRTQTPGLPLVEGYAKPTAEL